VSKVNEIENSPAAKRVKREKKCLESSLIALILVTRTRLAEVRQEYAVELVERQQIILGKVADECVLEGLDM